MYPFFIESLLINIKAIKPIRPCYNIERILGYKSNSINYSKWGSGVVGGEGAEAPDI